MLKKTITYQDLDGNPVTEDFYFNLSKAEVAEMELSHDGGFSTYLQQIVKSRNGAEIIETFKKIIKAAVGRRSEDGKRFIKSEEITNEFMQTDAYSVLFMELVTDANAATEFVTGIAPADLSEKMKEEGVLEQLTLDDGTGDESKPKDDRPAYIREGREPTRQELEKMSKDELQEAFRRKNLGSDQE